MQHFRLVLIFPHEILMQVAKCCADEPDINPIKVAVRITQSTGWKDVFENGKIHPHGEECVTID